MAPDPAWRDAAERPPAGPAVWSSIGAQPRGEGLGSLAEALDRILCKGVTVDGAVTIGVADVDLVLLDLRLLLAAIDTVHPEGPFFSASSPGSAPPRSPPVQPSAARSSAEATPPPATWQTPPHPADRAGGPSGGTAAAGVAPADAAPHGRKGPEHGLMRLVLTLVNLLHEVLERQAIRRMGNNTLTPRQIEDVGTALYAQAVEIARLRAQFGLSDADLTLRLSTTG